MGCPFRCNVMLIFLVERITFRRVGLTLSYLEKLTCRPTGVTRIISCPHESHMFLSGTSYRFHCLCNINHNTAQVQLEKALMMYFAALLNCILPEKSNKQSLNEPTLTVYKLLVPLLHTSKPFHPSPSSRRPITHHLLVECHLATTSLLQDIFSQTTITLQN